MKQQLDRDMPPVILLPDPKEQLALLNDRLEYELNQGPSGDVTTYMRMYTALCALTSGVLSNTEAHAFLIAAQSHLLQAVNGATWDQLDEITFSSLNTASALLEEANKRLPSGKSLGFLFDKVI